jgi:TRAP transporter TAXI family solute receptor
VGRPGKALERRPRTRAATQEPVAAVAKALAALRSFVDAQDEWGVRELGVALDLPPSTVHRLLARLRMEGFVSYDRVRRKYRIGFEFLRLSSAVLQRDSLRETALGVMRELTVRSGESAWLAAYDDAGARIAYIAEEASPNPSRYVAPLGRSEPMTEGACGISILAALDGAEQRRALGGEGSPPLAQRIRVAYVAGYAVQRAGELGAAMVIAAAILDRNARPVGSLCCVVPTHRFGSGREQMIGAMVRDAAERISYQLGARLLGGASAGSWQDAAAYLAGILHERAPGVMTTPGLGGGRSNLEDLARGRGAYALTTASSLHGAAGSGALRAVMNLSELHLFMVARTAPAQSALRDLSTLRVCPGEQGFSAAQLLDDLRRLIGPVRGRKTRPPVYVDYPEGRRLLASGGVDVLFWLSGLSNALLREVELTTPAMLWTLGEEPMIDRLIRSNSGYRRGTIPRDAFPRWLDADLPTIVVSTVLVCHAERSEAEVYQVARTIYEHRAELAKMSSVYTRIDANFAVEGLTAPLHPGAHKFFKELHAVPHRGTVKSIRGNT